MTAETFDVLIVGAGIAGASLAANLTGGRVALVEREARPGYHSTGRSAALFSEIYGNAPVRALTRASREFLFEPPKEFASTPLVSPRGALHIARADQGASLKGLAALTDVAAAGACLVDWAQARRLSPLLREGYVASALFEPGARDIDVNALHQGYLRRFGQNGGRILLESEVRAIRRRGALWQVELAAGILEAPIVVNAAGAWAEAVGAMAGAAPIGLTPRRRTVVLAEYPHTPRIAASAMTIDIDEQFYFKPDAGLLLISPCDEAPVPACDVQAEEMDVAVAIDRVERATTLRVHRIRSKWAGLRSFVEDRTPVVGFDGDCPGFFWLAGQGGYGIQTAPAMGRLAAALVRGEDAPADLLGFGVNPAELSPDRLISRTAGLQGGYSGGATPPA